MLPGDFREVENPAKKTPERLAQTVFDFAYMGEGVLYRQINLP